MTEWAIDSHVHLHKCFNEGLFFDSCFKNLSNIKRNAINDGILFFTEGRHENSYNYLKEKNKINSYLNKNVFYSINKLFDDEALELKWEGNSKRIVIIPGYQIVTRENLEVLILAVKERLNDGLAAEEVILKVLDVGGIPVLPWGFGKWYGSRGKKISELIEKYRTKIFLGDNGGRSNLLPYPEHFRLAELHGIRILPGSDPLPFPSEAKRPLSYGFRLSFQFDENKPFKSTRNALLDSLENIKSFGGLTSPLSFIKIQIAMQLKKNKNR